MAVVPDRRIALTHKLNILEINQKRVKEAISKIGKHLRHLLNKNKDFNGIITYFLVSFKNKIKILMEVCNNTAPSEYNYSSNRY